MKYAYNELAHWAEALSRNPSFRHIRFTLVARKNKPPYLLATSGGNRVRLVANHEGKLPAGPELIDMILDMILDLNALPHTP